MCRGLIGLVLVQATGERDLQAPIAKPVGRRTHDKGLADRQ
jgi:hypothetical protein